MPKPLQFSLVAALCALPIWLSQIDQQQRSANHIAFTITETDR
ncbi:MAG: hypothetical protein WC722_05845 [Rhodospirillales bacterium]|jgi:hypothetical protein